MPFFDVPQRNEGSVQLDAFGTISKMGLHENMSVQPQATSNQNLWMFPAQGLVARREMTACS